jgi:homogentisate 1,2-dioxygenase
MAEPANGAAGSRKSGGDALKYLSGFGNEFASEALPGALPIGQNSPQACASARRRGRSLCAPPPPPRVQSCACLPAAPQVCPYGLYAEQLSGAAFTAPRAQQRRSWLYRIRPAVTHEPFHPLTFAAESLTAEFGRCGVSPNQMRWRPWHIPSEPDVDFLRGLFTVCGAGRCAAAAAAPCWPPGAGAARP